MTHIAYTYEEQRLCCGKFYASEHFSLYGLTGKWDVKQVSLNELVRSIFLMAEIAMTEYRTQISGLDVIFDLEGLSIQHIYQISPSFASVILHWVQVCNTGSTVQSLFIIFQHSL